eukprot:maker-scaffold853_size88743-snap-gene-0.11 protein:Tk09856 transcript:maker-scaffold853_size88743-snap-gene-0.11-mRNA-1 annotation:"ankyrin repeat containing protein"
MCTPMSVMAQRGYYEGVKLLCRFGADTEDVYRLMTEMPGLPIAIAATYHHLKCFATLLLYGAKPGLKHVTDLDLPLNVITQCSVPHAIIKYRCPPEFVYLYREFGGNLWIRDSRQRLATDSANSNAPALGLMKDLQEQPLSLQSSCRLSIRGHFPQDRLLELLDEQGLGALSVKVVNFLLFRSFVLSADQIPGLDTPGILSRLERLLTSVMDDLAQSRPLVVQKRVPKSQPAPGFSDSIAKVPEDTLEVVEIQPMEQLDPAAPMAPGPPPPPPPPRVPRPGFWRFPGAELALDHPMNMMFASSLLVLCLSLARVDSSPMPAKTDSKDEVPDLEGSESQSFGYGYGSKVADKYGGVSTVYVHGFGTDTNDYQTPIYHDHSYQASHPAPAYGHSGHHYEAPKPYYPAAPYYKSGYGYGHINEYGDAKHGYGYNEGYGYPAPAHGYGNAAAPHHAGGSAAYYAPSYHAGSKYSTGPNYYAPLTASPHYGHHAQARTGFASGFGYGYIGA